MDALKCGSCRFWQRTDLPPDSNMLRRAAQTCSACKLAGVQIIPLPTLANQILARTFFRSVANLFTCLAVEKFCRASSAAPLDFRTLYCLKWAKSAKKRHGLPISEAPRCSACANLCAYPAVEKFCRASSAGPPTFARSTD